MEFFEIINYQNIMAHNINRTALSIARYSYSVDKIMNVNDKKEVTKKVGITEQLLYTGLNAGYARNKIFTVELKEYTKNVGVKNGINGISIVNSKFNEAGDGVNDIILNYRIISNVVGNKKYGFKLANRCYFRSWIGKSIVDGLKESDITQGKVYITPNGKVYHISDKCTHINISVTKVMEEKINNFRNSSGAKYYPCETCTVNAKAIDGKVYITAAGKRYHYNEGCGKIDRTIIEISKKDIEDKKLCSRCKDTFEK